MASKLGARNPTTRRHLETWNDGRIPLQRVVAHVQSELGNDVEVITSTISDWDVHYALLAPTATGLNLELVRDKPETHAYYSKMRSGYNVVGSYHLREINTSWYHFLESVGVLEAVNSDGTPGKRMHVPAAALFPVWDDGIIGEITWNRFDWDGTLARGWKPLPRWENEPFVPAAEIRNVQLFEVLVSALRAGKLQDVRALMADDVCSAVRTVNLVDDRRDRQTLRGHDQHAQNLLPLFFGEVETLTVANLLVGEWYVFAEYALSTRIAGEQLTRKLAAIHPITEDGRLIGFNGYAIDRPANYIPLKNDSPK